MPQLKMSDGIFHTCRSEVSNLFNFLKDDLDFNEMSVEFLDNNPLSFTLVIKIDDLSELKIEWLTYTFSRNRYGYFQQIALKIKAKMIEQKELAIRIKNEIDNAKDFNL